MRPQNVDEVEGEVENIHNMIDPCLSCRVKRLYFSEEKVVSGGEEEPLWEDAELR
jgi:hypothetical protein